MHAEGTLWPCYYHKGAIILKSQAGHNVAFNKTDTRPGAQPGHPVSEWSGPGPPTYRCRPDQLEARTRRPVS